MKAPEQLSLLDDVPVDIEAASEILALRAGSVVSTGLRAGESIDVFAGRARIGAGEFSSNGQREVIRMVRFGGND